MSHWKAALLLLLSLCLLVPGVTQPILSLTGTVEKAKLSAAGMDMLATSVADDSEADRKHARNMIGMVAGLFGLNHLEGEVQVFDKTRSIWSTVTELHDSGNIAVAFLVMLFSVIIPVIKIMLTLLSMLARESLARGLQQVSGALSKWSMADVFVVALIISFMAGNASAGMGDMVRTNASFGSGFWFFLGYCLLSLLGQSLMKPSVKTNY
ncbi:paraquat-inducible protein A [Shewanella avicenniae]|uniref:Paraquat-inducible protein A n=1 Tax=Shewanella avicenniae TaxID=2814294 RepID=A0ABX7QQR3_9GAMM|nr:paraquat-inducible protein A [Shewanella avicenniae]QSX33813.1 paraquat-inducible protein A [Shewanella avicenniae]